MELHVCFLVCDELEVMGVLVVVYEYDCVVGVRT